MGADRTSSHRNTPARQDLPYLITPRARAAMPLRR